MDYLNGWMHGSMGEGAWIWQAVGALLIVLLVFMIINQVKK